MEYVILLGYIYVLFILFLNIKKRFKHKETYIHVAIAFLIISFYAIRFFMRK